MTTAAIIGNVGLLTEWRTQLVGAAGLAEDSLGRRIHLALDGDGMALAGLPQEIRSLVASERSSPKSEATAI